MSPRLMIWLADLVAVVHFAFVAFVVVGLALIWIGKWRRWDWVANFWFRLSHLACIGVVVAESAFGITCPLTLWENQLRLPAGQDGLHAGSFIQHWVHKLMFFDLPSAVFTAAYAAFFVAVLASFWFVKPRWPRRKPAPGRG